jgi:hypothetical protein
MRSVDASVASIAFSTASLWKPHCVRLAALPKLSQRMRRIDQAASSAVSGLREGCFRPWRISKV